MLQKRAIKEYCKFHTTEAAEKLWDLFKNCVFKGKDRTSAELYDLGNYCESHEANKMKNRALKSILVRKCYVIIVIITNFISARRE